MKMISVLVLLLATPALVLPATESIPNTELWRAKALYYAKHHPWINVEIENGDPVEGKIIKVENDSLLVEVDRANVNVPFHHVINMQKIRSPNQELGWTLAIAAGALLLVGCMFKRNLR